MRDVESSLKTERVNMRKTPHNCFGWKMPKVQVHITSGADPFVYRPGDDIARCEFINETTAGIVYQRCPFSADSLRYQKRRHSGKFQSRGMELHELHIA